MKTDIGYLVFLLIVGYLVLTNWKGFNALILTSGHGIIHETQLLQGRTNSQIIA